MPNPPGGTVTFLFTDIEGSTARWEKYPAMMRVALQRHDGILRGAIESHGGYVFNTAGDELCSVFADAAQAVAAAVDGQRGLHAENWGVLAPFRVRMALHAGTAQPEGGNYFGPAVDRVARLMPAGHGGQVLLSLAAEELVRDRLPAGTRLLDMGERRLRDLIHREHIFQLISDDLPHDFPPLKTLEGRPNNLPARAQALIGREHELRACVATLRRAHVRLLTLTGPGGIGKTQLALHVATSLLDDYADGVFFVSLASVSDPAQVLPVVAQALGLREASGQALEESLVDYLRDKQILLVLDNFEQVLAAAPEVWALLKATPRARLLVTSRAALRLTGEQEYSVPPLSLPDPGALPPPSQMLQYEAVALFVARARAVKPDFRLTAENTAAVAQICVQLDGLPLAIELAAARTKVLSPPMILARLDSRLKLLTGGGRDLPVRQQTLRATIDWSFDLLSDDDRMLFRRLAACVRGCSLEAIEAFCSDCPDTLEALASLIDKSLLRQSEQENGTLRFSMLETIREYALERLAQSGEQDRVLRQHAAFYLRLAETAEPELLGGQQGTWLNRLATEHDNLQAAMAWAIERGEAESALRLAGALWRFWFMRSHFTAGRQWLAAALALPGAAGRTTLRAKALNGLGNLAWAQGDNATARGAHEEALAIALEVSDRRAQAAAHNNLTLIASAEARHDEARALLEQALAINRSLGDRSREAANLNNLGEVIHRQGDYAAARAIQEQSLSAFTALQDRWGMAESLEALGNVVADLADFGTAGELYERSLALHKELGDKRGVASALIALGVVAWKQGDFAPASAQFEEALAAFRDLGDKRGMAAATNFLGNVMLYQGHLERAEALYRESQALRFEVGEQFGIAEAYNNLGQAALERGDYARAGTLLETSAGLYRATGDRVLLSWVLSNLGQVRLHQGRYEEAQALFAEALDLARAAADAWTTAYALSGLGRLAGRRGDATTGRRMLAEALVRRRALNDRRGVMRDLFALTRVEIRAGHAQRAVQLAGAALAIREALGIQWATWYGADFAQMMASARADLGEVVFEEALAAGRRMTIAVAVAYAAEGVLLPEAEAQQPARETG